MINKFLTELKVNKRAESTIVSNRIALTKADVFRPRLWEWSRDDINGYILFLQKKYKPGTVETRKVILKHFFRWLGRGDVVAHVRVRMPRGHLKREDILDVDDVNRLIEATDSYLYKALIAFLFESGARISEVLRLRVSDLVESEHGLIINIKDEKTDKGYRRGLYIFSAQYLRNYVLYSDKGADDLLFDLSNAAVWKKLCGIARRAGVFKPVSAHMFRHAQATDMMCRGYQQQVIDKKMGWVVGGSTFARYQHLVDDDVIRATLERMGLVDSVRVLGNIKEAAPVDVVDAGGQFRRLMADNEELHLRLKAVEELLLSPELVSIRERIKGLKK